MTGMEGNRRLVIAADVAARAIGIHPGMAATQAQALVPDLVIHDAEPEADADGLTRLAVWVLKRYAPIVAADPPDGLMLDLTGAAHLHGGVRATLDDLLGRLNAAGARARAAVAPSYGAAHALARYSPAPITIVDAASVAAAIGPLPIVALRLDPETVSGLGKLGFDTIAELEAMPRPSLALRFKALPGRRLDQAYGRLPEPFDPVEAPEIVMVEQRFVEPIAAPETLARYTAKLVGLLCARLEADGVGARRLDLRFTRVDNDLQAIRAGTAKPTRDAKQLTRLLTDRLETIAPGFGIERMTLSAPVTEPLSFRTVSNLGDAPAPDVAALVDILANRVGEERLYRLTGRDSDVPERSIDKVAPMADPTSIRWPLHWPRPLRLFRDPAPIETIALLPDHPPVQFSWRGVRRRVKRADGPERIYGEWVRSDAEYLGVRDYFLVEDETGARFWIFRHGDGTDPASGSGQWFLHGLFG